MSEIQRDYQDGLDSMSGCVVPTDQNKNIHAVPAGYIRYADGTLEKFDDEEIWDDATLIPAKAQAKAVTNA
jgi:hypothetical protein